jgi:RNA polymerase sigma-70 factor (ECF subfamily)
MAESAQDTGRLLASARAGSAEALGKVLDGCRNYLLLVAGQELDADLHAKTGASDLVQEAFLEAHRDFAQFQGTTDVELLAWLRQILVNNVANFTRRYRAQKRAVNREVLLQPDDSALAGGPGVPDPMLTPSSQAIEREQAEALRRAMERLPDEYRQVLVLRFVEGRPFDEIGALLKRTPDAARKLWSRAVRRLRQEWGGPS